MNVIESSRLELQGLIHGILVYEANARMSLHEILFHPWLAMIKVPKQVESACFIAL